MVKKNACKMYQHIFMSCMKINELYIIVGVCLFAKTILPSFQQR